MFACMPDANAMQPTSRPTDPLHLPDFYDENRNLLRSREAFRKRLERRHMRLG
jgi:hypothetical protein